ncbi:MAG: hypothetical protein R2873_35605 [Caldilineaceae bacterium]
MRRRLEMLVDAMPPICWPTICLLEAARCRLGCWWWNSSSLPCGSRYHPRVDPAADAAGRCFIRGYGSSPAQRPSARLQLPPQPAHQLYQNWISWIEIAHATSAGMSTRGPSS